MKNIMPSLQWLLFIISGSLVAPVAIADLFEMNPDQTIEFIARSFFVLAITGLLQVFFGHRLPIHEGPAGLWWGVFVLYANIGVIIYGSLNNTLRILEFSLIASGGIALLFCWFGILKRISKYFTPAVTGTYLLLLVAQLSGSFTKGLLGIDQTGEIVPTITCISLFLIIISLFMARHPLLKQFGIVISLIIGYLLYYYTDHTLPPQTSEEILVIPRSFVFGYPTIDLSIIPTVFFITLLLMTNMLATIKVVENVLKQEGTTIDLLSEKKAGSILGVGQILGGLFSAMGSVAISGSAGFIATTKIVNKLPFIIASILLIFISFFKPIISLLATLPAAVGYAAIFPAFAGMISIGLKELFRHPEQDTTIRKVGIPLISGIGIMFVPSEAYTNLPPIIAAILSNGLVVGTMLILFIEVIDKRNH